MHVWISQTDSQFGPFFKKALFSRVNFLTHLRKIRDEINFSKKLNLIPNFKISYFILSNFWDIYRLKYVSALTFWWNKTWPCVFYFYLLIKRNAFNIENLIICTSVYPFLLTAGKYGPETNSYSGVGIY